MDTIPGAPEFYVVMGDSDTYRLARGWPYFESLPEGTGGAITVHMIGTENPNEVPAEKMWRGRTIVFAALATGLAELVDYLSSSSTAITIVDVTFPIASDGTMTNLPDGNAGAVAYWSEPENITAGMAVIRAADAVTTPRADWAADLAAFNPNVFVIPDTGLQRADEDDWEFSPEWLAQFMGVVNATTASKQLRILAERDAERDAKVADESPFLIDSTEQRDAIRALMPDLIERFGGTGGDAVLAALRSALGLPATL